MEPVQNPFACGHCPENFPIISSLLKHVQNKHTIPHSENENESNKKMHEDKPKIQSMKTSGTHKDDNFPTKTLIEIKNNISMLQMYTNATNFENIPIDLNEPTNSKEDDKSKVTDAKFENTPKEVLVDTPKQQSKIHNENGNTFGPKSAVSHSGAKKRKMRFSCRNCMKCFNTESALKKHEGTHIDVKNFSCRHCKASFSRIDQLKTHERMHTDEKPFLCKVCKKEFSNSAVLRRHERLHTGWRNNKCGNS